MPNVFTGQEFLKSLSEGKLKEPIVKIGMVKKPDDSSDTILFAEGGLCDGWISIPLSAIEQVTFLQHITCRDHQHPLVMIQFKEPDPKNQAASVFADLARRNLQMNPMQPGMHGGPHANPMLLGMHGGLLTTPMGPMGPGMHGTPQTIAQQAPVPDPDPNRPIGLPGLKCIVWRQVCGWSTLYISSLNIRVPIYVCTYVCDTWGIG
jgi:hypothetical protein